MADKQAVFTLRVDTGNSVQDVQNFDQAVQSLNKDLKETQTTASQQTGMDQFESKLQELNERLEAGGLSMRDMTKLMKEYQTLAAQAGQTSPIGQQAIQNAGELKDTIGDLRAATTALASDTVKLDTALAGIETGAAAFQGVQSAIALTGVESEALVQTMVKLQAAQGLVNAVQTVANNLQKDAILGIQLRSALQKAQNFILYGSVAATQAEATATKVATGAKVAMTGATQGANLALKLFRGALLATGIGALIVGLGLLIANFDKVVKFMQPVINGFKAIGDAIGLTDFAGSERASNEKKRNEEEAKQLERVRKARENAYNNEQKALDRLIALRSAEGKSTVDLQKQKTASSIAYQKELLKEAELGLEILLLNERRFQKLGVETESIYNEQIAKIEELKNGIADNENELKLIDIKAKIDNKKRAEDAAKDARDLRRAIEDEEIKAITDKNQREQTQLIVSAQRRIEDLSLTEKDRKKNATLIKQIEENLVKDLDKIDQDWYNQQLEAKKKADGFRIQQERDLLKMIEDLSEQNYLATLSDQDREMLAVQDKYFELETLAQGNADALQEIEIAKANELNDINLKYQEQRDKQNEEQRQKDLKREQDILEFKLMAATETFKLISDVAELFGKKGEKAARRAFMIQKASSIAQATIETYKGANAIFASAAANPSSVLFPAQPFISAGLAISAGLVNVAKIASQKFEGGSTPSDTGSSIPADLTGASASSFTANTNAQTTDLTTLGQGAQPGVNLSQVVVLESDITGTQNKVKLQEAKTSF
jgi:hypothetical protein